jgi:Ran GTPase-activating protein (RanGAP) involved in mRNA processing and transport
MLKANRTIIRLEFESNRIRDEGIFTMYEALQETDSVLQFLGLNDNEMTGKCCKLLAKMFISNKSLNTLHLAKNGLGGDGALLLGEGIRISHSIVNLDVSRNALGSKGIEKIFLGLKARPGKLGRPPVPGNDSLERLVARANNIHDDVVENIDELIMGHRCANISLISFCRSNHANMQFFGRRIQEVDLRDNDLSEASIKKIADVIAGWFPPHSLLD